MTVSSPASGGETGPVALFGLVGFTIFVWGINWPIMKIGLGHISPVWFAAWRLGIAAAFFFAIFAVKRRLPWPPRRDLPVLLSLAVLQLAGTMGFVHIALAWVEPGRSAILSHTHALWAAPLALIFLGERLTAPQAVGIALGMGGVLVIFNPLALDWSADGVVLGHLLLLWSALNLAIGMVHVRGHRWASSPLEVMRWASLLATVLLLGLALGFVDANEIDWSPSLIGILGFNGVMVGALGFLAYTHAARAMPPSKLALALLGTPVLGLLASAVWLGEPMTATKIVGLVLISGGVALVTAGDLFRRRR
ncbi:MAG: DMT family transporter [Alphaproteobacteria bacterium]|nr:DMT family transporter [Alphaproteobacteria bacterium]